MLLLLGWMMRAIILGAKFDECPRCTVAGPHLIVRKTHWFTVFRIPVVLLWLSHGVLCPECGYLESISFSTARKALRDGRLPLGRSRPRFEAFVRDQLGGVEQSTWSDFGLPPNSSEDAIRQRWRQLAKQLHPDAGGDPAQFVKMQALYHRLVSSVQTSVKSLPDKDELFDPVVRNPRRGFFDLYTKAWPVIAALVLIGGALQSPRESVAASGSSGTLVNAPVAPSLTGTAHRCWYTGSTLNGCMNVAGTAFLFGSAVGTATTCWFVEPLDYGENAKCY